MTIIPMVKIWCFEVRQNCRKNDPVAETIVKVLVEKTVGILKEKAEKIPVEKAEVQVKTSGIPA